MRNLLKLAAVAGTAALATATAEARVTRIEIAKTEPAFAGASFGAAGTYQRLTGQADGGAAKAGLEPIPDRQHRRQFGLECCFPCRRIP